MESPFLNLLVNIRLARRPPCVHVDDLRRADIPNVYKEHLSPEKFQELHDKYLVSSGKILSEPKYDIEHLHDIIILLDLVLEIIIPANYSDERIRSIFLLRKQILTQAKQKYRERNIEVIGPHADLEWGYQLSGLRDHYRKKSQEHFAAVQAHNRKL